MYEFNPEYLEGSIDFLNTLKSKVIWPWPKRGEEGWEQKIELLREGGYREWRSKSKTERKLDWQIQNPIVPLTSKFFI